MTIRARLTLWYGMALAVALLGFAAVSYGILQRASMNRIDRHLETTARSVAGVLVVDRAQTLARDAVAVMLGRVAVGGTEILLLDRDVGVVSRAPRSSESLLERATGTATVQRLYALARADGAWATLPGADGPRRVFVLAAGMPGGQHAVVVAQSLEGLRGMLADVRRTFVLAGVLLLAIIVAAAYFVASRAIAPVGALALQAEKIGAASMHRRLGSTDQDDEVGRLAAAFNALLNRLDRAMGRQREFMADASHELRTPIAVIRGEADITLAQHTRPEREYRDALGVIHREARGVSRLVDDLLLLARDGEADTRLFSELYLDELVGDCVRAARTLGAEQGTTFRLQAEAEMPMRGDEGLLWRLVSNLLHNAIIHGIPGDAIIVRCLVLGGRYIVTVEDHGPGIDPALVREGQLFARFTRGSRDRHPAAGPGGAGLGLAIARRIAEMHGGTLEVQTSEPGRTVFRFTVSSGSSGVED